MSLDSKKKLFCFLVQNKTTSTQELLRGYFNYLKSFLNLLNWNWIVHLEEICVLIPGTKSNISSVHVLGSLYSMVSNFRPKSSARKRWLALNSLPSWEWVAALLYVRSLSMSGSCLWKGSVSNAPYFCFGLLELIHVFLYLYIRCGGNERLLSERSTFCSCHSFRLINSGWWKDFLHMFPRRSHCNQIHFSPAVDSWAVLYNKDSRTLTLPSLSGCQVSSARLQLVA